MTIQLTEEVFPVDKPEGTERIVIRKFAIRDANGNFVRELTQADHEKWPDMGVPDPDLLKS